MSEKRNWKSFAMEFLLIVVGINLGLFVNNLNEQRKETKLERQLLSELKVCLEGDLEDVNLNIEIHTRGKYSGERLGVHFNHEEPIDSLSFHLKGIRSAWSFLVNNTSTYESLKSIGFGIIKNNEVRQKVTELYNVSYRVIYEFEKPHNELRLRWEEIFINSMGINWQNLNDPIITKKVREIENFEYFLRKLTGSNSRMKRTYIHNVKPNLEELIALIDKELEE